MVSEVLITIMLVIMNIAGIISNLSIPLFLIFMILKLCGVIAWSWLIVCIPLIVGAINCLILIIIAIISNKIE